MFIDELNEIEIVLKGYLQKSMPCYYEAMTKELLRIVRKLKKVRGKKNGKSI